jgi:hypothetical protein
MQERIGGNLKQIRKKEEGVKSTNAIKKLQRSQIYRDNGILHYG